LEKFGIPIFSSGCSGHFVMTIVGDADSDAQANGTNSITSKAILGFQTSSHGSLLAAAVAGSGLACIARFQGDRHSRLRRLQPPSLPPKSDVWMLEHDPEKWYRFSEKIMLKQKDWR
jgi:DNA-binding transcriptional LysR family regulator